MPSVRTGGHEFGKSGGKGGQGGRYVIVRRFSDQFQFLQCELFQYSEKGDCVGCLASLTSTILACAASETGVAIAACVAGIVGTGNTCYPCICWAIEQVLGRQDWFCDWCDC